MRVRSLLGGGGAALVVALASAAFVAPGPEAFALPPECHPNVEAEECEPEPPPPPAPPGPIARSVAVYAGNEDAIGAVHAVTNEVLDRVAPANRAVLEGRTITVHVIPQTWDLTELPRWADKRGQLIDGDPYGRGYDELRGAQRSGGGPLDVAVGEERMVTLGGSGYTTHPNEPLGSTLVHEIGHAVKFALTPSQRTRLATLHTAAQDAVERGQTNNIIGRDGDPTSFVYTTWTEDEFFAEATAAWFERNGGGRYLRSWVQAHNPGLYTLLDEVYALPPPPVFCEGQRATLVMTTSGTIRGTTGQDIIVGSPGRDTVIALEGDDLVCAGGGNDLVSGGNGADRVRGESGADELWGAVGDDDLIGGTSSDQLYGGYGHDDLDDDIPGNPTRPDEPGNGNDHMEGGPGNDRILGGTGDDTLIAGSGTDELYGTSGNDHLDTRDSSPGDIANGDSGTNQCVVDTGDLAYNCTPVEPTPPPTTPPPTTPTTAPPPPPTTTTQPPPPPPPCPPQSPPSRCHEP